MCDCSLRLDSFQLDGLDLPDFASDSFYDIVLGFSQCNERGSKSITCDAVLVVDFSERIHIWYMIGKVSAVPWTEPLKPYDTVQIGPQTMFH